jgi:outer membrane receptor protein involved in Fe transport
MNRNLLATAICASLFAAGAAHAQTTSSTTQDQSTQTQPASQSTATTGDQQKKKEKTLQTITVTGSLIPQSQIETANPVITLSAQKLQSQGFGTVYEALRAQPLATGSVQDNQFTGGFTPGAQTISLLGLDPGFTLFLINGHPMADYPLLYNGSSNFVDLSDIPVGMVDHIDILPGNQSSIYGSSAIAGVVNVILKQKMEGYELDLRGGGYTGGGGSNERLEFLGGYNTDKLSMIYGVQLSNQKPIFGYQRSLTGTQFIASRNFLDLNGNTGLYNDPGAATCAPVSSLYGGTVGYQYRPGHGYYCGSKAVDGYATILNQQKSGTGYLNATYSVNDNTQIYGNVLYNVSSTGFTGGPYFWEGSPDPGSYFVNGTTGEFEILQHIFAPEEIGGWQQYGTRDLEHTYNAWVGVKGSMGNSDWNYDVFFARSSQKLDESQRWPLKAAVNSFFEKQVYGPQLGTYYGYPIYDPNFSNFYKPLTQAQYATFNGDIRSSNSTWTQNFNIQLTNDDLFNLPAGPVGFAGIFQIGEQMWSNPGDPRVTAGEFYGLTGTSGGGYRNNWAYSGELRIPIFKMLTADISARYDQYSNHGGGVDGDSTYKVGLEFRPTDTLLIRGTYSTGFRAPDMAYVFGGQSGFYQPGLTDYYRCAIQQPGPIDQCTYFADQDPFALHTGNLSLKSITSKSAGFGVVWSPTSNFNVKADYYNIRISNEVQLQSIDALLRTEAACRLGQLDINSAACVAALSQVLRSPYNSSNPNLSEALEQVTVFPINIANERVSGIVASLDYNWDLGRFGNLDFGAQYNVTLKHTQQLSPNDPVVDLLRQPAQPPYSTEFKTIANGQITWTIGKWATTLYGTRYGKSPNYNAQIYGYGTPGAGSVAPWMLYSGSVAYNITPDMKVSAIVHNIMNSMPPSDASANATPGLTSPYYNEFNYNPYGRQFWVEFDWKFGKH